MNAKLVSFFILIAVVLWPCSLAGGPISVRLIEGTFRGFVVLRSLDGTAIAHGEVSQKPTGMMVESRTILRFKDGSLFDELATFSQEGVFRLEGYRLEQRGPSYPTLEVSFDRKSGRYQARSQAEKGSEMEEASGSFKMPADLYNGMSLILLKNLPGGAGAKVKLAVFMPEPRLVEMEWNWEGEDEVLLGANAMKTMRSLVKLKLGGIVGVFASLIGKSLPDLRYWIATGDVPAFVKFEGAMFLNGPVWRLEMTTVGWPN